jgi:signal transduction histidine kinase
MTQKFHNVMQETYVLKVLLLEKNEEDHIYFSDMFENIRDVDLEHVTIESADILEEFTSLRKYDLIFIGPALLKSSNACITQPLPQVITPNALTDKIPEETGALGAVFTGGRTPEEEKHLVREVLFWIISDARGRSRLSGELRQNQKMLESSEARFEKIVRQSADGIIIVNTQGKVLFVNPAAEEMLNRTTEELLSFDFGFPVVAEDFTEIEIVRKDLQYRTAEMRVVNIEIQKEPVYLVSLRDITERKKTEEELLARNRELDDFTYVISHDLKAPLALIGGYLDVIHEEPQMMPELIKQVENQVGKLSDMLESLLKLSRAGKVISKKTDIDLVSLINESLVLCNPQEQPVEIMFQPDIPTVKGDPERLKQVFTNLIQNSLLSMNPDNDKLCLEIGFRQELKKIALWLRDNGRGIEQDMLNKLFVPAFTTRKEKGSGFGLAICKKIIEAHGGKIWAESPGVNKGATLFMTLPV